MALGGARRESGRPVHRVFSPGVSKSDWPRLMGLEEAGEKLRAGKTGFEQTTLGDSKPHLERHCVRDRSAGDFELVGQRQRSSAIIGSALQIRPQKRGTQLRIQL